MSKIRVARVVCLVSSVLVAGSPTLAAYIWDPLAPMSKSQLANCELVVLAHYQSHTTGPAFRVDASSAQGLTHDKKQTLTLRVSRVLKGSPNIKAGSVLHVELRHWYTIETGNTDPYGFSPASQRQKGTPRLCYKVQVSDPGLLVPVPVVANVRSDVLYFFPKAQTPTLERKQQVQLPTLASRWEQILKGHQSKRQPPVAR